MSDRFDRTVVSSTAPRPWPMPDRPWLMTQSWHDLLFAHWRVDYSQLRSAVPDIFEIDVFDDQAWLAVVPFSMTNVGLRGFPAVPWLSAFPELNVRTYVRVADRPGVYFFSLDAGRRLAVAAARTLLNLPYHTAAMTVARRGEVVDYRSVRRSRPSAEFKARYRPVGRPFVAAPGSLEYFLTERYCLYHRDRRGRPYRLEIHHPPWSLQLAEAKFDANAVGPAGVTLEGAPAQLHFAKRQDVIAWAPMRLDVDQRSVRKVTGSAGRPPDVMLAGIRRRGHWRNASTGSTPAARRAGR